MLLADIADLLPPVGWLDLLLIVAVTAMGVGVAYLHDPQHKAFLLMLPFPFTIASISVGKPIGASHVLGLLVMSFFALAVWWLHAQRKAPILLAIVAGAAGYMLLGGLIARGPWQSELAFWLACGVVFAAGLLGAWLVPVRKEPGYRTPLPLPAKATAIAGVVIVVVLAKAWLQGTMATFPMVGVVAAYEARFSLWTIVRRMPWILLTLVPMMAACHVAQHWGGLSLPWAMACGWPVFLVALAISWRMRDRDVPVTSVEGQPETRMKISEPA